MEIIEEIVKVDGGKSHNTGILPYVAFNSDNSSITNVDVNKPNGNFGQYVCDFVIFSGYTDTTAMGTSTKRAKELKRLRYLDIMVDYYLTQKALRNGVFTKRYNVSETLSSKVICPSNATGSVETESETRNVYKWKSDFEDDTPIGMYDYTPMDISFFSEENGLYSFEVPSSYYVILDKPEDERTEDEVNFLNKVQTISAATRNSQYAVLIEDYDDIMMAERRWKEWWEYVRVKDEKTGNWENLMLNPEALKNSVFSNLYTTNNPCDGKSDCNFIFAREVDKFIIGRTEVIDDIPGSRVPNFVYYTEYYDRKSWFEQYSAATVNAYANPDDKNQYLIKRWESRGGGAFYQYLVNNVKPLSINYDSSIKTGIYAGYAVPRVSFETLLANEEKPEWIYSPYEYSVIGNQLYGVVKDYEPEEGSNLKPHFVELSGMVESKLETLQSVGTIHISNDITGVYKEFAGNSGQLYECVGKNGTFETVIPYNSGYSVNYHTKLQDNDPNKTITISGATRIPLTEGAIISGTAPSNSDEQVVGLTAIEQETTIKTGTTIKTYDGQGRLTSEILPWSSVTTTTYRWLGCNPITDSTIHCGDGEDIAPGTKKYRNATILSCAPSVIRTYANGDTYYIMARFDNGNKNPSNIFGDGGTIVSLSIPYVVNERINVTSYDNGETAYDTVTSITPNTGNGTVVIEYVIGATDGKPIATSGIHYREEIPYSANTLINTAIDGVYMADLYYDKIDFSAVTEYVYSTDYRLSRLTHRAEITGMEVGTQWTSGGAVTSLLVTKDNMEGLQDTPRYDIELSYNRGNAAAWEGHFKLSECNTMQDLENYGNNFFNL